MKKPMEVREIQEIPIVTRTKMPVLPPEVVAEEVGV
jgi:hypothetical protein